MYEESILSQLNCIGYEALIAKLDEAAGHDDPKVVTQMIKSSLEELIGSNQLKLPQETLEVLPGGYGRRLIHHSEEFGYTAVAMTWGAEQGTPIHDHCNMWCVEAVWHGSIEVVQYDLLEQNEKGFHFERVDTLSCELGTAGTLIPPYDYHVIKNACNKNTAVTLHIYEGDMKACNVFEETDEPGWYNKQEKHLSYNN